MNWIDNFQIGYKIKRKYRIYKIKDNECICKYNNEEYKIKPLYKNKDTEGILSNLAKKLTSIKHQNIHNVEVLEDEEYFYLVSKDDLQKTKPLTDFIFKDYEREIQFEKLFECYLQICEALKYLHAQKIYHGNISPQNILVSYTCKVFLLDFGSAYYYTLLDSNKNQINHFISPEQYLNKDLDTKTDIFSFGLCMLQMLTDTYDESIFEAYNKSIFEAYNSPHDIDEVFEKIYEYELEDVEKELYPLIKTMLETDPAERPDIKEVSEKLDSIYKKDRAIHTYEINVLLKEVDKYCKINDIAKYYFKKHFEEKLKNSYAHILLKKDRDDRDQFQIAFRDIVFICGADDNTNNDRHLFCIQISYNSKTINDVRKDGIMLYDTFVITAGKPEKCHDDTSYLKQELKEKLYEQQIVAKKLEQDIRAIDTEDKYLKAVEEYIENEKKTQKAKLINQNRGSNRLVFDIIHEAKDIFALKDDSDTAKEALAQKIFEDGLSDDPNKDIFITLQDIYEKDMFKNKSKEIFQKIQERNKNIPKDLERQLKYKPLTELDYQSIFYYLYPDFFNRPKKEKKKDFKNGDKVVFHKENPKEEGGGNILRVDAIKHTIHINVKDTTNRKDFEKGIYFISRDVEIEEKILRKQQNALDSLKKSQTACPRLLQKINNPSSIMKDPELFTITDIDWFNKDLDDNQKQAVNKALNLEPESDILLIQGPPGTGKTTTITEIVKQYLKENKHEKIIVVSQSNQAVDNVLEKICEEVKVVRIGKIIENDGTKENEKVKISPIAQNYTESKVLDKLIKDNIQRIKDNPTDKPELKQIQKDFLESLQTLSQEISETESRKDKTVDSELANIFLKDIRVLFGTLIGISSYRDFKDIEFGLAIVDEAGRAFLSELLVPLIKAKKIILVGDHKQLAPIVKDEIAPFLYKQDIDKEKATESFFGRFYARMKEAEKENLYHFLSTNYRAHSEICRLYSEAFYDGELQTPSFLDNKRKHELEIYKSSVIFLSTSKLKDKKAKQESNYPGWYNPKHISIIKKELGKIFQTIQNKNLGKKSIGIISPYRLQVRKLRHDLQDYKDEVDIGTVDSFQGSDRDIIIYDSVRSGNKEEHIGFISDEKRLNVSLSRAKELLIIVGDAEFLYTAKTEDNNPFKEIIENINRHKNLIVCKESDYESH